MKKMRLVPFILSALLIAGALAVLPAPREAEAASALNIVSSDPANRDSGVLAAGGRWFTVTFNYVMAVDPGYTPYIYWYDPSKSSWAESSAPCVGAQQTGSEGVTLTFALPASFPDGLPANTTFGIMLPGPANVYGDNAGYHAAPPLDNTVCIHSVDTFDGIDFPSAYCSINDGFTGCWTFKTALSYDKPAVQSMLPASGSADVDPNAEIHLYFNQPVSPNAGTHCVEIKDYNTDDLAAQILTTDLVIAGSDVTIPAQDLEYNKRYYITIFTDSFIGGWSGLTGGEIYDKSLNFTTQTSYTLTYTAGAGGSVSGTATQTVPEGEYGSEVSAVADSASGYEFVQWSDGVLTENRTDLSVGNLNVEAQFALKKISLDYDTDGYGTLSVGGFTGLSSYHESVDYGSNGTTVTAVPNTGYYFTGWSDGNADAARTDTGVTANVTATANFEPYQYSVHYGAGPNGTISGNADQTVSYGQSSTPVTAVPNTGYHFVKWSDDVLTAGRTDTITGNLNVTAEFALETRTLTYIAGEHGVITGNAAQSVAYGGSGTQVTATPALGYHFVQWSDGKLTASRTDTNVTANLNVTATFGINTYILTYTAGAHGTLTGDLDQSVEYGGSGTQVIAVPDENYHFSKWSDGVVTSYRTDTNVIGNKNVTAEFAVNKFKVTFKDYDGTVLKTQYVAYGGDATPPDDPEREGYTFTGWDGDYHDVTSAETVTAEYYVNTYKVTFADYDGKELKVQNVLYGGSATPPADPVREGYTFTGWSGDYTKIKGVITFTAEYEADTFKVKFVDYDGRVIDEQDVEGGGDAAAPADPVREGYVFTGWDKAFTGVTADITVTAQYKAGSVITKKETQDGSPVVVVNTGDLDIAEVTLEGGKASVNPDGTLKLEFPDDVKAGDYKLTFKLADGTTLTETITITDEDVAAMASADKPGTPVWLWILIGALVVVAAVLIVIFVRRLRYSR